MYTVGIQVSFSAAHYHRGAGKECEQIHGHNYRVEVEAAAPKLQDDMVVDFRILREHAREVVKGWDHRLLNELNDFKDTTPTTENISRLIFAALAARLEGSSVALRAVRVWEKEDSWAEYRE